MIFDIAGRAVEVLIYDGIAGRKRRLDIEQELLPRRSSKLIASSFRNFCRPEGDTASERIVVRVYDMADEPGLVEQFRRFHQGPVYDAEILVRTGLVGNAGSEVKWTRHDNGIYETVIGSPGSTVMLSADTYTIRREYNRETTLIVPRIVFAPQVVHDVIRQHVCSQFYLTPPRRLLLHGAGIVLGDIGYLLCAVSGGGKTTVCRQIRDKATVLSDEAAFVYEDLSGQAMIAGAPWVGRELEFEACNDRARLAKILFIAKSPVLRVRSISQTSATVRLLQFALVHPSYKSQLVSQLFNMASDICRCSAALEAAVPLGYDVCELF